MERQNKRLLFTVTTGRSGTAFLASVLRLFNQVSAHHEPEPHFRHHLRSVQADPELAARFWREEKLPAIARLNRPIYAETSHLICKGFLEPLIDLGITPDLILLLRPHRQVALSLFQLNTIPGRTDKAGQYYLRPDDPNVASISAWQHLHDYQLCYWYCLEIARRQIIYQHLVERLGARTITLRLDELNTLQGFRRLQLFVSGRYQMAPTLRYLCQIGSRTLNAKSKHKCSHPMPSNIGALETEVQSLFEEEHPDALLPP